MKKTIAFLLCVFLSLNIAKASPVVYEKPDVKIIVEGSELQLDAEVPIIVNSRTLIPLRRLLVGLGVPDNTENIQWIGETREVKVIYNGVNIDLAIDSTKGYINGKEYTLDAAPIIHRDRTYLPARFVGEALGYTISWDQYTPAVLVTSDKNMEKLREILNDLNTAMNNVNSYELVSLRKTSVESVFEGEIENIDYEFATIERADLGKKIIYTENNYKDEFENSFYCSYNTPDAFYSCELGKAYIQDAEWEKYNYDPSIDEETPFDGKEKLGIIKMDESLYGSLLYKEYSNAYVVSSSSNQIDILKSLDGMELYNEINEYGDVENFSFQLAISKDTSLPISMEIKFDLISEGSAEDDSYSLHSVEKNEYRVEFLEYNQYLKLEVPNV